ncbi:MAG: TRAP transporter large permease subunit, partial [Sphingomonadales bacterium]
IMFIIYQILMAKFRPETSPAIPPRPGEVFDRAFIFQLLSALLPPIILIIAVLGSILSGAATPTSAAALGAVGATMLAGLKQSNKSKPLLLIGQIGFVGALILAYYNRGTSLSPFITGLAMVFTGLTTIGLIKSLQLTFKNSVLTGVMNQTLRISTMVFTILVGAAMFSLIFRGIGGDELIANILTNLPGGPVAALILVMLVMFILGFFLDFLEITFVVVPIVAPILIMMGYNPIWLGVMMAMNLQTSFLTPPFGFALFYLRGVADESLKTSDIYKGALPFVGIQMFALILLAIFPELATWLPEVIFKRN